MLTNKTIEQLQKMRKLTIVTVFAVAAFGTFVSLASAQTANPTAQELLAKIAEIQQKISDLKAQQQDVVADLITQLKLGDHGPMVGQLQAILIADGVVTFSKPTDFYGPLTAAGVSKLRVKAGLPPGPNVGPATVTVLKAKLAEVPVVAETDTVGGGKKACVPPGWYVSPAKSKNLPNLPSCKNPLPPGIQKIVNQGGPGGPGGQGTTTPDIIPPVISAVSATSTTASTTHIGWSTNELATSKVWYATSAPVSTSTALMASSATFTLSHDIPLMNLSANTTYFYKVESADQAGNAAISSEYSFITLP